MLLNATQMLHPFALLVTVENNINILQVFIDIRRNVNTSNIMMSLTIYQVEEPVNDANPDTDVKVLSNTIFELVKQNNEFKQLLIEQNHKMMEMAGNMGNNNNNTVNSNNKFNLNVFLNEKCKNAMTLKDFVKSINISVQDFIETGETWFYRWYFQYNCRAYK